LHRRIEFDHPVRRGACNCAERPPSW